jgi:hypothetical protein
MTAMFPKSLQVAVEEFPEVSFTHTSPMQCWDSVRDRVNEEIKKQRTAGKSGVPALLFNDSVNGLEMFGFFSPPIIEVDFQEMYSFCSSQRS